MRVIGGIYKSRVLASFDGEKIRPTADRSKEALFNILGLHIRNARVLDLFCGSGAIGIESLSRGAKEVLFNDCSKESVALVKKNLANLKIELNHQIKVSNYDYLVCLGIQNQPFDFIFIDPPYMQEFGKKALEEIAKKELLTKNGIAVYERDRPFDGQIKGLQLYDERKYGKAYFSFFKREER